MTFNIKQFDTRHALRANLLGKDGQPTDLSKATVEFVMRKKFADVVVRKSAKQTDNPGEVWVVFDEGDTDVPGQYTAEFYVTYADSRKETFPTQGYIDIKIEERVRA